MTTHALRFKVTLNLEEEDVEEDSELDVSKMFAKSCIFLRPLIHLDQWDSPQFNQSQGHVESQINSLLSHFKIIMNNCENAFTALKILLDFLQLQLPKTPHHLVSTELLKSTTNCLFWRDQEGSRDQALQVDYSTLLHQQPQEIKTALTIRGDRV